MAESRENREDAKFIPKREKASSKKIIKYVRKPSGTCVTWLKFVAVMLAASLLLWQLIEKIQSYIENPVVVTREITYLSEIPFPGLILCNKQPLRHSYVSDSAMKAIIGHYLSQGEGDAWIEDKNRFAYFSNQANSVDMKEFYANASQKADDFIVECSWVGGERNECSSADFELIHTDYGPCYKLKINETNWPNMTAAGPADAFQIVLNIDTIDSYRTSPMIKSRGALIALFRFDNPTPLVSHTGYSIPIGFEANMAVRSEYIERLSKKKKGQCDPDASLSLFDRYTTAGCYLENRFMHAVNACQCLPYNFPEYRNEMSEQSNSTVEYLRRFPRCNVEQQYSCVEGVWNATDAEHSKNLTCLDACDSHRYATSFTYATIAGDQLREGVERGRGGGILRESYQRAMDAKRRTNGWEGAPPEQYYRENFVVLNIYFKEILDEKIVQHLTYDGWGFAGDIAATVGIILGFLLTSLGEVIENCIWLNRKIRGRPAKDPGDDDVSEEEELDGKNDARRKKRVEDEEEARNQTKSTNA